MVAVGALAVATVAVVGLVPASAQTPACTGLTNAYNHASPVAQPVLLQQLTNNDCALPTGSSSSTSSTMESTSSTMASTTSTMASTSSTSMVTGGGVPCAGINQALTHVTNPTARQALADALARCTGTGTGTGSVTGTA